MNDLISAGRHEIRTADNEEWIYFVRGNVYSGHSSNDYVWLVNTN